MLSGTYSVTPGTVPGGAEEGARRARQRGRVAEARRRRGKGDRRGRGRAQGNGVIDLAARGRGEGEEAAAECLGPSRGPDGGGRGGEVHFEGREVQ